MIVDSFRLLLGSHVTTANISDILISTLNAKKLPEQEAQDGKLRTKHVTRLKNWDTNSNMIMTMGNGIFVQSYVG